MLCRASFSIHVHQVGKCPPVTEQSLIDVRGMNKINAYTRFCLCLWLEMLSVMPIRFIRCSRQLAARKNQADQQVWSQQLLLL